MTNYYLKLKALLHDPVHKIWSFSNKDNISIKHEDVKTKDIKWHEKVALDLYYHLLQDNLEDEIVKNADNIAAGLSRILVSPKTEKEQDENQFEEESSVFLQDLKYIDFLSGKEQEAGNPTNHEEIKDIFKKLGDLNFTDQEERSKFYFLFLWRFLPEIFPWINTHPADSRVPNHSIYDHLVQTSALASCLEKNDSPTFLLFTIGPVQEFISKAKKTSDLWAGSFLLSYLTFSAIQVVMEEIGPDNIIFPNLIGQPFVDRWLYEKFKDKDVNINVFTKWKNKWKSQLDDNSQEKPFDDKFTIANIPNRFLAIIPYGKSKDLAEKCKRAVINKIDSLVNNIKDQNIDNREIEEHCKSFFNDYYVILPWGKNNKSDINNILENYKNLISNNKRVKIIELIKQNSFYQTPSIGITYSLLVELTERFMAARKNIRDFVNIPYQEGKKCKICGEYSVVDKDDELCGVCYLKRKLPELIKDEFKLANEVRYPSTSEMATVKYKVSFNEDLANKLKSKISSILSESMPRFVSVPKLKGNSLYTIDGQFLMEDTYRKEYLQKEYGIDVTDERLDEIKKFLNENKISPPVYYAILAMDGDEMGKWLNGSKMPQVKHLMHHKTVEALEKFWSQENKNELDNILNTSHPMSPSFHNGFSRRLSNFALNNVRAIVEEKHYGKLIYAGGDDVLAFLPVDDAIDCAYELHQAFKERLSQNASMSAGIVFVHHKYPLSLALNEVRSAEKQAKDSYGRNACCVKLLRNSGEKRVIGFKWDAGSEHSQYTFFKDIIQLYDQDKLSSSFAYQFMEILQELGLSDGNNKDDTLKEIIKNELKRIYLHKQKNRNVNKQFFDRIIQIFESWQFSYNEFANMFIVARFLSKEGKE